ncbi:hypothetical protein ASC94_04290 [Massilia sp. Root418]|uniref:hypothetical protein n=1 Tax=Massilia sp. Root418 TaxID=1736532 RepID=UPI0007149070|nr:hypothetical protein [Massilia sp. Root418]KQX01816.1 hypothetical protein ASC94_04290 [Massilia sp. Root418]
MTISSLTSSSAASQLSYVSKLNATSGNASGEGSQVGSRPPPPDDGGFIDAIASALQSLGLSSSDGATADSTGTSSTGADTGEAAGSGNAAQALGSFLHELMGALHEQGTSSSASPPPGGGQAYGPPGGGGPGGPGGPGKLEADLQSLVAKLTSGSDTATSEADEAAEATNGAGTGATALETSFQSLLEALGSDTSDASGKLASFLQALSDILPNAGSSGNLINTSV